MKTMPTKKAWPALRLLDSHALRCPLSDNSNISQFQVSQLQVELPGQHTQDWEGHRRLGLQRFSRPILQ